MKKITIKGLIDQLRVYAKSERSHWSQAVINDAFDLLFESELKPSYTDFEDLKADLLNGAQNWEQYSCGGCGCALIYDEDIAKRYCTPSELKRCKGGELPPNSREQWLDVQARALMQACGYIRRCWKNELERGSAK